LVAKPLRRLLIGTKQPPCGNIDISRFDPIRHSRAVHWTRNVSRTIIGPEKGRAFMDVGAWLRGLGLGQYEGTFRESEIEADVLPELTEADLEKLGLPLGSRKRILKAIAILGDANKGSGAASLAHPSPEDAAERRQLTVMFCDLAGSTALSARLDPEDMRQVIRAYQDACSGVVARYDGFVAKFMGDGILAYFGFPHAHEDDGERAVRAGLEIVGVIGTLETRARDRLKVRIGIATGLVVVGDLVGHGAAQEQAVVGDTPNLAARLQALAEPDSVVVAAATRRLLGDRFRLRDLGRHAVKGLVEPVEAWIAEGVSWNESRFEATHTARLTGFVGREAESALLRERQRRAWQGEGQIALISGEAGIGKSCFSSWLAAQVADEPHTRLRYQCSPYHRDSALHPFAQQLVRAAQIAPDESPERKLVKLEAVLGLATARTQEIAPLIASLLSIPLGTRYPLLGLSPAQQRRQTLAALLDQLEGLAQQKPVLMLFEDAHWADATSLELLNLAIERVRRLPVLLLITFRPEFEAPWKGLPDVATVALARLDHGQAEMMIERVTGGRKLPAEVLAQIVAKTDGVPLFVEELTKNVLESGLLIEDGERYRLDGPLPPLAIPSTLQDSLMARLDRLGTAKEIAQIGAAIGREFSYALLNAVVGRDEPSLRAALAQLEDAELLFRAGTPPDASYSFKHALVQDTAYESLLKSRRLVLHRRIALTLEERFPGQAEAEPEVMAHHFSRAGLADQACLYHERAGDHAVARFAYAEAVAHFDAALKEVRQLQPGEDRNRRELALLLKYGPAILIFRGVQGPEVEPVYQRAYDIAEASDDGHGLFKSLWGLWFCANMSRRTGAARDRAEQLVALGRRSQNEALFLEAIHCRWSTAFFRGDIARLLADGREGIKHYDIERHSRLGAEFGGHDPGVCAYTVLGLGLAQFGSPREAKDNIVRGVALGETLKNPSSLTFACMNAMTAYQIMGDLGAVSRLAQQMMEVADKFNLPPQRSIATFMSGWLSAWGDDLAGGLQAMETEFPRVSIMGPLPPFYAGLLASIRLEAGQFARALDPLDMMLRTIKEPGVGFFLPEIHRLRAECLLRLDPSNFDEAVHEFELAIATAKQQQARVFWLRAAMGLSRASAAKGAPEQGVVQLRDVVCAFSGDDYPAELAIARQLLSGGFA
jgi:class 3 adenylate cyclase/tetratricopeptide (TPR) repeat protein